MRSVVNRNVVMRRMTVLYFSPRKTLQAIRRTLQLSKVFLRIKYRAYKTIRYVARRCVGTFRVMRIPGHG